MIKQPLYLNQSQLQNLLDVDEIISVGNSIIKATQAGRVVSPKKFTMPLPGNSASEMCWINSMPAYLVDDDVVGIKWVSVVSANKAKNLPTVNGLIILNELSTGIPFALLDAGLITHYRNAASICIAAKKFCVNPLNTITIIGPGQEAKYIALFLLHCFDIRIINVVYRGAKSLNAFTRFLKKHVQKDFKIIAIKDTDAEILKSDFILCSSTSMSPILNASHLAMMENPNCFICGLTALQDISVDVLDHVNQIIVDDGMHSVQRIMEVSGVNIKEKFGKPILKLNDSEKVFKGINLFLPTGISALDIGVANYFFKKQTSRLSPNLHCA